MARVAVNKETKKTKNKSSRTASIFGQQFIADSKEIVDVIISYAVELESQELHFEWQESQLRLRWRIGGKLAEPFHFNGSQATLIREQLINKFAIEPSRKLPFEERTITFKLEKRVYFLTLSVMSVIGGDRFFLRISKSIKYDLERLELNKVQRQCLDSLLVPESGIFIVGAVKAADRQRLLKAIAGQYKRQEDKVVMISEHPIYDWLDGEILAIRPEIGFSRIVALRAALETDFDYVLLDFITNLEELELVMEMAEKGKRVLIGLPWNSPSKNFHYLWQLAADKVALRRLTKGMVVEAILPKLCARCRKGERLSLQGRSAVEQIFADMPGDVKKKLRLANIADQQFYQSKGCFICKDTGFSGAKYFNSIVRFKKPGKELELNFKELVAKQNFISLRQLAIIKAGEGEIDLLNALSFTY